jgi:hypothetical protein
MASYEVAVLSDEDDTDTVGHLFADRDEAELACESVLEWFPHARGAVVTRQLPATITYEQWMERGW